MWFTISWDLDEDYLSVWEQYANARRINQDVECEGRCATLTNWPQNLRTLPRPARLGKCCPSPRLGWNDLDSLDIGDGALDGLTNDEKRSAVTLWALANAPMYLGGDLTRLDSFGKQLLSNDDVIGIDQSGTPAKQALGGDIPVWVTNLGHNNYIVALFNTAGTPVSYTLPWDELGFANAADVRDLWLERDLGPAQHGFTTVLPGHGVRLLRVAAQGSVGNIPFASYEAESAILGGSAVIADCPACSRGAKVGGLGLGAANNVTFNNVEVKKAGTYLMRVDSMTEDLRSYLYTVNGGPPQTLNSGGGSFFLPTNVTVPVRLKAGLNVIQFGNATSFPPDRRPHCDQWQWRRRNVARRHL